MQQIVRRLQQVRKKLARRTLPDHVKANRGNLEVVRW